MSLIQGIKSISSSIINQKRLINTSSLLSSSNLFVHRGSDPNTNQFTFNEDNLKVNQFTLLSIIIIIDLI